MKKIAIVGVEGSGKTVMLAGLGDLYTYPDEAGYFLAPKNFGTASYVADKIARMRRGEWPSATAGDEMQGLDWTLRWNERGSRNRPIDICEVSFLDFPGEVYRVAYGIDGIRRSDASLAGLAEELKRYIREADDLIVLINLRDVIVNGTDDRRVQEAMWITNSILDQALSEENGRKAPRAAIILSQADSYADAIRSCGGPLGLLQRYLPHVANNYAWLDVFEASAVDRTILDDEGNVLPASDFKSEGLRSIIAWIIDGFDFGGKASSKKNDKRAPVNDNRAASGNAFVFNCPICGHKLRASSRSVGRQVKCPSCGGLIVPQLGGAKNEDRPQDRPPASSASKKSEPLFSFNGRKSRAGYWRYLGGMLLLNCFGGVVFGIANSIGNGDPDSGIVVAAVFGCVILALAGIIGFFSCIVRRLHDLNRHGLFCLLLFVPWVNLLVFLALGIIPGTNGDNDYGPKP